MPPPLPSPDPTFSMRVREKKTTGRPDSATDIPGVSRPGVRSRSNYPQAPLPIPRGVSLSPSRAVAPDSPAPPTGGAEESPFWHQISALVSARSFERVGAQTGQRTSNTWEHDNMNCAIDSTGQPGLFIPQCPIWDIKSHMGLLEASYPENERLESLWGQSEGMLKHSLVQVCSPQILASPCPSGSGSESEGEQVKGEPSGHDGGNDRGRSTTLHRNL